MSDNLDVEIEGITSDQVDALLKKYKNLKKYKKSNIFAIKTMDGSEDIISSLVEEAEDVGL